MALIAKDKSGGIDFAPVATGMHPAVCYAVIDIGTQPKYGNFPSRRKVVFCWEIPGQRIEMEKDGRKLNLPRAISEKFTLSLASKGNLRPMLECWRGRAFTEEELDGFDVSKVLGANCLLNIIHERGKGDNANKVYANVASVNPLAAGMPKLKPENPQVVFSMDDFAGPVEIPVGIPEWIAGLIVQSDEYALHQRMTNHPSPTGGRPEESLDEDVPF